MNPSLPFLIFIAATAALLIAVHVGRRVIRCGSCGRWCRATAKVCTPGGANSLGLHPIYRRYGCRCGHLAAEVDGITCVRGERNIVFRAFLRAFMRVNRA